ncbi:uncharacterized protein LOC144916321 isoform X2 [Branchiostoma floridae x Branchiostoma belcheri]
MAARGAIVQYLSRSTQTEAICLKLPSDLASCLFLELSRSPAYTLRFARWVTRTRPEKRSTNVDNMLCNVYQKRQEDLVSGDHEMKNRQTTLTLQQFESRFSNYEILSVCLKLKDASGMTWLVHVAIELQEPMNTGTQRDLCWSKRLHPLVTQKVHLENLFSYLCTVGGAYSALGDYNMYHADQAAVVSLQQLKIASTLGDPVLLSCCCLWYALSLMQKGLFKQAENIVSKQYQFSKTPEAGCNQRLQKMCQGIWNKIKAMKTVRGTQNNHLEPRAPKELY